GCDLLDCRYAGTATGVCESERNRRVGSRWNCTCGLTGSGVSGLARRLLWRILGKHHNCGLGGNLRRYRYGKYSRSAGRLLPGESVCPRPQSFQSGAGYLQVRGSRRSCEYSDQCHARRHQPLSRRFGRWSEYGPIWSTWWLGDAGGALVITPLLVLWLRDPRFRWNRAQLAEAVILLTSIFLIGQNVFGGFFPSSIRNYPLEFLCIPFLIWAAFRFSPRETATAVFVIAGIAISGTLAGFDPFVRGTKNESLVLLQVYVSVSEVMSFQCFCSTRMERQPDKWPGASRSDWPRTRKNRRLQWALESAPIRAMARRLRVYWKRPIAISTR